MIRLIRVYKETGMYNKSLTIVGGAEAWTIADQLAPLNISVILRPPRCTPGSWATRRCLVPGTFPSAVEILRRAGVNVALANVEDNFIRGLIFEAGNFFGVMLVRYFWLEYSFSCSVF